MWWFSAGRRCVRGGVRPLRSVPRGLSAWGGTPAAGSYVVIGINFASASSSRGIAWQAHLGGLITGAACAVAIGYLGKSKGPLQPPDRRVHWAALAAIGIVLVLLTVARYATA